MKRTRRWLAVTVCVLALGMPLCADEPATDDPAAELARRLAEVGASLDRIATTLDALLEGQRVDVMLKRIELAERRIDPLERALERGRDELEGVAAEIEQIQAMRASVEQRIEEAMRAGAAPDSVSEREFLPQIDAQLELLKSRLSERERRVREVEDDIARERGRIEVLDDTLRDLLER